MKKVHYSNLNALRFIAAFIVIVHHTEQIKFLKGLPNIWGNNVVVPILGKLGVDLFFVLSGFLITSLLFVEADTAGGINVKNFIVRRILRIWPVYFVVVALGFFIMPPFSALLLGKPYINVHDHYWVNLIMYILFLPHIQAIAIGPILYASQAWSIGIEEQFYLIWPFIAKYLSLKKLAKFIIVYTVIYLVWCAALSFISHNVYNGSTDTHSRMARGLLVLFQEILKFDCLLIGGLFAIINNYVKRGSFLRSKIFQIACYVIEVILVCLAWPSYGVVFWEVHAILYGFIIMNLVHQETSIFNIEYPILSYLGKISYGLYMYHILVVNITIWFVYKINKPYLLYPLVFGGVIFLASLSYNFLEKYFLRKKIKYSSVITG